MRFFSSELLTVEDDVVSLTPSVYNNTGASRAAYALVSVKGAAINYRFSGTPSANSSHEAGPGSTFEISGYDNIVNCKFIQLTGDTAQIYVEYGN